MRPLRLTLKGFRSHRDGTEINFQGRGLVGVVGPIGSGKSSILDAISFALFGQTPAGGAQTKSLIHQQAASAHVEFWFESGDQIWRVVRALRRKGQAAHTLVRFDEVDPGASSLESYELKADVDAKVQELLGMEFPAFSRSIMLAQGRFAQLLQATPTEANKVLQSVFGFDQIPRMRDVANTRVAAAQARITALGDEAHQVQDAKSRLSQAEELAKTAHGRQETLAAVEPRLTEVTARQSEIQEKNTAVGVSQKALTEAVASLPPDAADVVSRETSRVEAFDAGKKEVDASKERLDGAAAVRQGLQDAGTEATLSVAELVLSQRDDALIALTSLESAVEEAEALQVGAGTKLAAADKRALEFADVAKGRAADTKKLQGVVDQLTVAAEQARRDDAAHDLRAHLSEGEACPVCEQAVNAVPALGDASALQKAEDALTAGRTQVRQAFDLSESSAAAVLEAQEVVAERKKAHEAAQLGLKSYVEQLRVAHKAISAYDAQLKDRLGKGDPMALVTELRTEWAKVSGDHDQAVSAFADADSAFNTAVKAGAAMAERFGGLLTAIAVVSDRLDLAVVTGSDPVGAFAAISAIEATVAKQAESLKAQQGELTVEMGELVATLSGLLKTAEVSTAEDFTMAFATAKSELLRHATTVDVMRQALERGGDVGERLQAAEADLGVYQALAKDLTPSKFLAFMLDEERFALITTSSTKLAELSAGRYGFSLSEKAEIEMIDNTAAEYRRAPSSLSGGETFLASLALALGLAEMVAGGAGTLDAFFLDEGFGSLDAEHLDLAMEGIEQLVSASSDRLVVLVSHVAELRERVEDLIVLDRDPDTGASTLLSGGGAPSDS